MSEGIGIFVVSFLVGLVGVLLPQYILHLLRMRRMKRDCVEESSATIARMAAKQAEAERHIDEFVANFNKERAEINARIKQGARRTNGRIK